MSSLHDILRYPHVTEKTTLKKELSEGRVIAFQVRPDASKRSIKEAVEQIFDVKVEKVRTANFIGKIKSSGRDYDSPDHPPPALYGPNQGFSALPRIPWFDAIPE